MLQNFPGFISWMLYREKLYTVLNVSGLGIGIASCIILGLYLHSEFTYDLHHLNHNQIYRVAHNDLAVSSPALGPMMVEDFPVILSRNILVLVIAGGVVSSSIAWYVMDGWLSGFAYHTDISPFIFLLSATVTAIVAFITISLQSYKTAQSCPVNSLRHE